MLFLFGTRIIGFVEGRGNFFCPHCQAEREFKLKHYRRYFTLFLLPVIPLENYGSGWECQTCKKRYEPQVSEDK